MKKFKCIKLNFISPLHLGRGVGEAYDTGSRMLHSDTISAALASARVQFFGDKNLNIFMESLKVSSAFPFFQDSFFFPKPMMKLNLDIQGKDEYQLAKNLKELEYIEQPVFEQLIAGKKIMINENQFSKNKKYLWNKNVPDQHIIKTDVHQRVTIPPEGQGETKPYYVERLFFKKNAGLFFLLECDNTQTMREMEVALKYLEDTGIGTDRSVGNGFFKSEIIELQLDLPEDNNWSMTLSLFCPDKEEIFSLLDGNPAYLLEKRGGFIAGAFNEKFRHLRKKSVFMFSEGSVFKASRLRGKVLDLRPNWDDKQLHQVFRSGIPFSIPVNNN